MANTIGEKELKHSWPFTSGLTAGTTKTSGRRYKLPYEKSYVPNRQKVGI